MPCFLSKNKIRSHHPMEIQYHEKIDLWCTRYCFIQTSLDQLSELRVQKVNNDYCFTIIIIIFIVFFQLSQGIWNKFMIYQQTEDTFKKKIKLWKCLSDFIKVHVILTYMQCMSNFNVAEIKSSKKEKLL